MLECVIKLAQLVQVSVSRNYPQTLLTWANAVDVVEGDK